ncbi:MAG: ROK family transcriptional regulator [Oscillospiraceae bacterium]|nr:ROK family transcriptional regulator [Oscillospiraceae bacterium]
MPISKETFDIIKQRSSGTANYEIKGINRSLIFNMICENSAVSRKDIQKQLDLSLPTIGQNITELLESGLIKHSGTVGHTGGRRAETFSINERARVAVGMDITKKNVTLVLLDLIGNQIASKRIAKAYEKTDDYMDYLGSCVAGFLQENGIRGEEVLGVGIGIPALTDVTASNVVYSGILDMSELTAADFERHIHYPVKIFNDANAACFAELYTLGGTEGMGFYIMLSNNVGGAVFLNNKVYIGENFRSGEVGHLIIHQGGKQCYCGQKGCLDPYCSATVLKEYAGGSLEDFFSLVRDKDEGATKVWDSYLEDLAIAVRNVRILFDCPIILGGSVGAMMEAYMTQFRTILRPKNTFDITSSYVRCCQYKVEAIASGAALHFVSEFLGSI